MKVLEETNSGLIIAPDIQTFMLNAQKKSDKKVNKMSVKTYHRNQKMLELVATYPNISFAESHLQSVIYNKPSFIPPKWIDTIAQLKAIYYQRAIESMGGKHTFTFNLSPKLTLSAINSNGLKYIRRQIDGALSRHLGRKVEFWLVLESIIKEDRHYCYNKGRPHIHGSLLITDDEINLVKTALRSINRKTSTTFKLNETRIKPVNDVKSGSGGGDGWASYITKHNGFNNVFMPYSSTITKTHKVGNVAQKLYIADRNALMDFRSN